MDSQYFRRPRPRSGGRTRSRRLHRPTVVVGTPVSAMAGTIPNHALDTQSRVGQVIAILTVPCVLSTLVVVLRIYCRAVILGSFGKDDAVIIPAQVRNTRTPVAPGELPWARVDLAYRS